MQRSALLVLICIWWNHFLSLKTGTGFSFMITSYKNNMSVKDTKDTAWVAKRSKYLGEVTVWSKGQLPLPTPGPGQKHFPSVWMMWPLLKTISMGPEVQQKWRTKHWWILRKAAWPADYSREGAGNASVGQCGTADKSTWYAPACRHLLDMAQVTKGEVIN